ncbi:hypothetical protein [Loktanella sp. DSM 29012]|nr:hypothetical protein [Loktanella sp. DSM 29012]
MTDAQVLTLFGLFLLGLLATLLVVRALRGARGAGDHDALPAGPEATVIVDGSNVMHWGGDPSLAVLLRVLDALRDLGHVPAVVFDANVGYKLFDRFHGHDAMARALEMPERLILVVDRGDVADTAILAVADEANLPVVSNDRFREWSVQYPWVKKKGRILRGAYDNGAVTWTHPRR